MRTKHRIYPSNPSNLSGSQSHVPQNLDFISESLESTRPANRQRQSTLFPAKPNSRPAYPSRPLAFSLLLQFLHMTGPDDAPNSTIDATNHRNHRCLSVDQLPKKSPTLHEQGQWPLSLGAVESDRPDCAFRWLERRLSFN
jgi:hypothetical protein